MMKHMKYSKKMLYHWRMVAKDAAKLFGKHPDAWDVYADAKRRELKVWRHIRSLTQD